MWNRGYEWSCGCMLGGGRGARTIGQACRRGAAGHRTTMRALSRLRLHTRAKRQRQKARSEISVGNDAARAANSGAVAARVSVLRRGVFCPGKDVAGARQGGCAGQGLAVKVQSYLAHQRLQAITERIERSRSRPCEFHVHLGRDRYTICSDRAG